MAEEPQEPRADRTKATRRTTRRTTRRRRRVPAETAIPVKDTLTGPLMRMAKFYPGDTLPRVHNVHDIHGVATDLRKRKVPVGKAEEKILTKILWCLLHLRKGRDEIQRALSLLGALVFAIVEDDDFYLPEDAKIPSKKALKTLAMQLMEARDAETAILEAIIEQVGLRVTHSTDLAGIEQNIPPNRLDDEVAGVLNKLRIHLEQGEEIFAGHTDDARREAHRKRMDMAYNRASFLLARLMQFTRDQDHPVVRAHIVRREHKHVEIDALGAQRINEKQQARATKEFLAWTEDDLGEALTDENKEALAAKLREQVLEDDPGDQTNNWFFDMD